MSWNPVFIVLIIISTLTDYFAGILLSSTAETKRRKLILTTSILVNIGLLAYFKYANFILENVEFLFYYNSENKEPFQLLDIILPVGISFYTFQTLSYTIDVYYQKIKPERNLKYFALYVCFFPQLVAGPIERYSSLVPQFKIKAFLNRENISTGFRLILFGLFMKMVIADNFAVLVDNSYSNIGQSHSLNLMISAVLYSFQIYCDFYGYSTIAIGVAKLFNINLIDNFKTPYFANSLTSFWRSWHISLTTWFRDYLYYPMGGNRDGKLKWFLAFTIVFVVSGIWHGAKWTFVIWGLLHGLFTISEKLLKANRDSKLLIVNFLRVILTFCIVTLLWVLFRSPDFGIAKNFYTSLITNWNLTFHLPNMEIFVLLALFITIDFFTRKRNFAKWMDSVPVVLRWSLYFVLLFLILSRSGADTQPFIYFQF